MPRQFKVTVNGREYEVAVLEVTAGATSSSAQMSMPGTPAPMMAAATAAPAAAAPVAAAAGAGDEVAQMGGVVVQVDVKVGQTVAVGDKLLVLEAMKMKSHLLASRAGKVTRIMVAAGDPVEGGQPVMTIQ
ncbi:MAG TPA: hypothetical protein PLB25_07610 [Rhodoferax sp.]|nr:hypothetical protein [Rhodoferax sp.]